MNLYLREQGPNTHDGGAWVGYMSLQILEWWGDKSLANVNKSTCQSYVKWRTVMFEVSDQTARHELKTMRAAINYYHASEHGPLTAVPVVTLPAKAPQKLDYWLTRKQVADRIRAARKRPRSRHVIRLLLIGVYTGTRPGATKALRWVPSTTGGWFDLESETLHRRALGKKKSKKMQPPARIHSRLLPHLRRWRKADLAKKITNVVHYYGKQIDRIDSAWDSVALAAGHAKDGPHICRHTAATWQMQAGTDRFEAAGYLGMSPETLWDTYGHHSPAFQSNASKAGGRRSAHESAQGTRERRSNESGVK
jgi:integrase